jgi:hypothetical protein
MVARIPIEVYAALDGIRKIVRVGIEAGFVWSRGVPEGGPIRQMDAMTTNKLRWSNSGNG